VIDIFDLITLFIKEPAAHWNLWVCDDIFNSSFLGV